MQPSSKYTSNPEVILEWFSFAVTLVSRHGLQSNHHHKIYIYPLHTAYIQYIVPSQLSNLLIFTWARSRFCCFRRGSRSSSGRSLGSLLCSTIRWVPGCLGISQRWLRHRCSATHFFTVTLMSITRDSTAFPWGGLHRWHLYSTCPSWHKGWLFWSRLQIWWATLLQHWKLGASTPFHLLGRCTASNMFCNISFRRLVNNTQPHIRDCVSFQESLVQCKLWWPDPWPADNFTWQWSRVLLAAGHLPGCLWRTSIFEVPWPLELWWVLYWWRLTSRSFHNLGRIIQSTNSRRWQRHLWLRDVATRTWSCFVILQWRINISFHWIMPLPERTSFFVLHLGRNTLRQQAGQAQSLLWVLIQGFPWRGRRSYKLRLWHRFPMTCQCNLCIFILCPVTFVLHIQTTFMCRCLSVCLSQIQTCCKAIRHLAPHRWHKVRTTCILAFQESIRILGNHQVVLISKSRMPVIMTGVHDSVSIFHFQVSVQRHRVSKLLVSHSCMVKFGWNEIHTVRRLI